MDSRRRAATVPVPQRAPKPPCDFNKIVVDNKYFLCQPSRSSASSSPITGPGTWSRTAPVERDYVAKVTREWAARENCTDMELYFLSANRSKRGIGVPLTSRFSLARYSLRARPASRFAAISWKISSGSPTTTWSASSNARVRCWHMAP